MDDIERAIDDGVNTFKGITRVRIIEHLIDISDFMSNVILLLGRKICPRRWRD